MTCYAKWPSPGRSHLHFWEKLRNITAVIAMEKWETWNFQRGRALYSPVFVMRCFSLYMQLRAHHYFLE